MTNYIYRCIITLTIIIQGEGKMKKRLISSILFILFSLLCGCRGNGTTLVSSTDGFGNPGDINSEFENGNEINNHEFNSNQSIDSASNQGLFDSSLSDVYTENRKNTENSTQTSTAKNDKKDTKNNDFASSAEKKSSMSTEESKTPSVKNELVKIELNSLPEKTTYIIGESVSYDGLTIKLFFADGSTKIINNGFECKGFSSETVGKNNITVYYKNKTVEFQLNIISGDVNIFSLNPVDSNNTEIKSNLYDTSGNYYDKCLRMYVDGSYFKRVSWSTYKLNGKYSKFSAVFAYEDSYHIYSDCGDITLNIYADDTLIYTKRNITKFGDPFTVNLDIPNCNFFKIYAMNENACENYLLVSNAKFVK